MKNGHNAGQVRHPRRESVPGDGDRCRWKAASLPSSLRGRQLELRPSAQTAVGQAGCSLPPLPRRCILVPLDGSSFAEHALPLALEMARRGKARLVLVHVACCLKGAYSIDLFSGGSLHARIERQRWQYLNGVVRRLAEVSPVPATPVLLQQEEAAGALRGMAEAGVSLVVMATHARGPLARLWRGSVADTLLQRLSVPLLLVRGQDRAVDLAVRPRLRRVLIPLDGSAFSEQVLGPAMTWGTLTEGECTLVHVIDPRRVAGCRSTAGGGAAEQHLGALPPETACFARTVEQLGRRGLSVSASVLVERDPARAILTCARRRRADLIALASWGRGGLSRLLRGSVADRVIRGAAAPVLVFRPRSGRA